MPTKTIFGTANQQCIPCLCVEEREQQLAIQWLSKFYQPCLPTSHIERHLAGTWQWQEPVTDEQVTTQ
jgi:hypothetical protein